MIAKKELEQIRGVVREEIDGALEDFAVIVNKGFEQTASKTELDELHHKTVEGFRVMHDRLNHQDAELSSISTNIQE